ncbi:MAG: GspH/FimT family pseudopilin [Candidatus Omnitrophota bacterium]
MKRKIRAGYTFIELVFVILVVAILAAVALFRPGFDFTVKAKVRTAAQRLVSDLRLTRTLAVTNNENYKLVIDQNNNEYSIFDSGNTQSGATRTVDSNITLTGDTEFIFQALGNASSGSSASLEAESNQYNIDVVSVTGMVNMQEQ